MRRLITLLAYPLSSLLSYCHGFTENVGSGDSEQTKQGVDMKVLQFRGVVLALSLMVLQAGVLNAEF
jgi:hypothetical protein